MADLDPNAKSLDAKLYSEIVCGPYDRDQVQVAMMIEELGYLFTAHGTILFYDAPSSRLKQGIPPRQGEYRWLLSRRGWTATITPLAADDGKWMGDLISLPSTGTPIPEFEQISRLEYAIKFDDFYLCAEPDGRLTVSRPERRQWETFAFVDAEPNQFQIIKRLYQDFNAFNRSIEHERFEAYAEYSESLQRLSADTPWAIVPRVLVDEFTRIASFVYEQIGDLATLRSLVLDVHSTVAAGQSIASKRGTDAAPLPVGRDTSASLHLKLPRGQRAPDKWAHLQDAHVVGGEWFAFSSSTGLLRHSVAYHHNCLSHDGETDLYKVVVNATTNLITRPAILLGGHQNYYHNLMDFCINAFYYHERTCNELFEGRNPSTAPFFLVAAFEQPFHEASLQFVGIDPSLYIQLKHREVAFCEELILLPQTITSWGFLRDPRPARWLTRLALRVMSSLPSPHMIYISREKAERRLISNEKEVQTLMLDLGISVIHLEGMTVAEQLRLFARAKLVIGMHGAGLANIIVCPTNTSIVEIMPKDVNARYFTNLAAGLGHKLQTFSINGLSSEDTGYRVDCDRLREFLYEKVSKLP